MTEEELLVAPEQYREFTSHVGEIALLAKGMSRAKVGERIIDSSDETVLSHCAGLFGFTQECLGALGGAVEPHMTEICRDAAYVLDVELDRRGLADQLEKEIGLTIDSWRRILTANTAVTSRKEGNK